jgi:hypothetical protein
MPFFKGNVRYPALQVGKNRTFFRFSTHVQLPLVENMTKRAGIPVLSLAGIAYFHPCAFSMVLQ